MTHCPYIYLSIHGHVDSNILMFVILTEMHLDERFPVLEKLSPPIVSHHLLNGLLWGMGSLSSFLLLLCVHTGLVTRYLALPVIVNLATTILLITRLGRHPGRECVIYYEGKEGNTRSGWGRQSLQDPQYLLLEFFLLIRRLGSLKDVVLNAWR